MHVLINTSLYAPPYVHLPISTSLWILPYKHLLTSTALPFCPCQVSQPQAHHAWMLTHIVQKLTQLDHSSLFRGGCREGGGGGSSGQWEWVGKWVCTYIHMQMYTHSYAHTEVHVCIHTHTMYKSVILCAKRHTHECTLIQTCMIYNREHNFISKGMNALWLQFRFLRAPDLILLYFS